jgi:hypothetical protein
MKNIKGGEIEKTTTNRQRQALGNVIALIHFQKAFIELPNSVSLRRHESKSL